MTVPPALELRLLGTPRVLYAGNDVTDKLPAKAQALLYYLAVTGGTFSRQALAGLLWGGVAERKALTSLRVALNRMRKVLPDCWEATQQTLAFAPTEDCMLDVQAFARQTDNHPPGSIADLQAALSLYRGEFLAQFFIDDAPEFDEWLDARRAQYRQVALDGLAQLSERLLAEHAYADAVHVLQRYLEIQPWDEEIHRRLMLAYCRLNNLRAALEQFQHCRRALLDELGVEPMPETLALHERIETALHIAAHNIPDRTTPFIGRVDLATQLRSQLMDSRCRLLTLLGPGGIGKTRLAQHVARTLVDEASGVRAFINGAFWVPLESVTSPSGIISAIASAVGFHFYGGVPPEQQLIDFLRAKEMLLVLDNLEHLLDGVELIASLLAAAPHMTILVTSREVLNLHAEWTVEIDGLAVPTGNDIKDGAESEAVQLFIECAHRVRPDFPMRMTNGEIVLNGSSDAADAASLAVPGQVAQICRLVDGIPLAIELAAAWLDTLSAAEIAQELTHSLDILSAQRPDGADRHASMRVVFNHSWEMLGAEEQRILRRLSVFRNGFSLEAATSVAGASLMDLALLSEKSLVRHEHLYAEDRYYMHELLRQYVAEKLAEVPEEQHASRTLHSRHYLALVREREEALQGPQQQSALATIGADIENIRTGWRWAIETQNWPLLEGALEGLYHFYQIRSFYAAGEESFGALLEQLQRPELASQPAVRSLLAKTLSRRGAFSQFLCNFEPASVDLVEGMKLAQALELPTEEAFALNMLGQIATWQGDRNSAQELLRRSLSISRRMEDRSGTAYALEKLANTFYGTFGEYTTDKELAEEALTLCRAMGRPDWIAYLSDTLGFVTFCLGEYEESLAHYRESVELFSEIGESNGMALALGGMGLVYWAMGSEYAEESIRHFERSLMLTREIGNRGQSAGRLAGLARLHNDQGDFAAAQRCGREMLNIAQALESPIYLAHAFACLGDTARGVGDYETGREHLRQAIDIARESHLLPLMSMALFHYAELLVGQSEDEVLPSEERMALRLRAWQILGHLKAYKPLWFVFRERAAARHAALGSALFPESDALSAARSTVPPLEELVSGLLRNR